MSTTPPRARGERRTRGRLIALAVILALLLSPIAAAITISLQNDAAAAAVRDQLLSIPLPPETELVDSFSKAGKLVGNGNGMQYLGAILIRSDLSTTELESYYAEQASALHPSQASEYATIISVEQSRSARLQDIGAVSRFTDRTAGPDDHVVYMWGDAPSWLHEDWDLRGH